MTSHLFLLFTTAMDPHHHHTRPPGGISVAVTSSDGQHLPGALVFVKGSSINRNGVTNSERALDFRDLPVGTYTVVVTLEGFSKASKSDIEVKANSVTQVHFALQRGHP